MSDRIYLEDINVVIMLVNKWMNGLEGLEKEVLKLEIHTEDNDLLYNILKYIHSTKRESSFIGLVGITKLSFEMEFILEAIMERRMIASTERIDSLLLCVDFLNTYTKRLLEKLSPYHLGDEATAQYLDLDDDLKEEQILESLKLAREQYMVESNNSSIHQEVTLKEEVTLDILHSEEFKNGLAEGVKEQFLIESSEHIERIENDLLIRLDSNNADKEAIHEVFRSVHSIKGGTGIYLATLPPHSQVHAELKAFLDVVHTFESLLALLRDKECNFDNSLIDLSLIVMDYLKSFISSSDSEESSKQTVDSLLDQIHQQMLLIQALPTNTDHNLTTQVRQQAAKAGDIKPSSGVIQSIRVNQDKIDNMMNIISELFIAKNSFLHISTKLNMEYDLPEMSKEVKQVGAYINKISDELQNAIMSIRMVEIKSIFQKMPRVIRDIAQSTGKKMELSMEGENTEIDKTIIEQISDPLVHLIRNSADHGIEDQAERLAKQKPETGHIVLRAYNKNKYVFIEIEDDGKGIDAEKIKRKAIEKGVITEEEALHMTQNQLINLVFLPGFSTAQQITDVSGRGVGMDIVRSNISKINGNITIESEVDKGTKMTIRLPLSLAVSRGLIVEVSGDTYIIPLEFLVETVKINRSNIHKFNGKYFTHLRGAAIGMEWLCKLFLTGERDLDKEELNAVILSNGVENYAIVVDKLRNEQEFVVKTLEGHLSAIPGIAGSTLLGNGQVVLIVNPTDILELAGK
ncbi:chemotaxis protein CheA [Paenibacillus sp. sgz500958]|uniref:chemotaxis protein CheA n=1 Tax=Paenibacillus sp. sgz500958 TaxID=3242475 RepID=UPI0036D30EA2